MKDGRGKTWHDHLISLVSRQVLQEVVMQVDKINSCPRGVSATKPSVATQSLVLSWATSCRQMLATYALYVHTSAVLSFLWCCPICPSAQCAVSLSCEWR